MFPDSFFTARTNDLRLFYPLLNKTILYAANLHQKQDITTPTIDVVICLCNFAQGVSMSFSIGEEKPVLLKLAMEEVGFMLGKTESISSLREKKHEIYNSVAISYASLITSCASSLEKKLNEAISLITCIHLLGLDATLGREEVKLLAQQWNNPYFVELFENTIEI